MFKCGSSGRSRDFIAYCISARSAATITTKTAVSIADEIACISVTVTATKAVAISAAA